MDTVVLKQVEVKLKARTAIAKILEIGPDSGMFVPHLAELLNVSNEAIKQQIRRHAIITQGSVPTFLQKVKNDLGNDFLPPFVSKINFLPIDSVKRVIKHIGTEEAMAIYLQLWDDAAKLATLEKEHTALLSEYSMAKAKVQELEAAKSQISSKREAIAMSKSANLSKEVKRLRIKNEILRDDVLELQREMDRIAQERADFKQRWLNSDKRYFILQDDCYDLTVRVDTLEKRLLSAQQLLDLYKAQVETERNDWRTASEWNHTRKTRYDTNYLGQLLSKESRKMGLEIRKVRNTTTGYSIAYYHKSAVDAVTKA